MTNRIDDMFQFNQAALNLRAARQELMASNIANADTPNYKARDIDFASALQGALAGSGQKLQVADTSPQHLAGATGESVMGAPVHVSQAIAAQCRRQYGGHGCGTGAVCRQRVAL